MKLDDRPGPAVPLSREAEEALISSALDASFETKPRRRWLPIAAAAIVLLGAPAAVAAWMAARAPDPVTLPKPQPQPQPEPKAVVIAPQPEPEPEPEPKPKKRKKQAEDLLAKANELRRGSKWSDAERVYLEVAERFPKSGSAYVALVAAGSLRLEHLNDPAGALSLLSRAAKKKGPLGAEILWNQSRAHRKLGDAKRERAAIEKLLAEHPEAPFAEAAQARLQSL